MEHFCTFILIFLLFEAAYAFSTDRVGYGYVDDDATDEMEEYISDNDRVPSARVIGGQRAVPNSWPWMALLKYTATDFGQYTCGATIISDRWLLTAAHCAEDMLITRSFAYIGIHSRWETLRSTSKRYTLMRKVVHPRYDSKKLYHDIAVLELSTRLSFNDNVQPIRFTFSTNEETFRLNSVFSYGFVTGWGQYTEYGRIQDVSYELRQARLPFIRSDICRRRWPLLTADQLCAGAFMKGSGQGDSGGPLQVKCSDNRWYQVGIVSYGGARDEHVIDQGNHPGVYTRVSHYCSFIREKTGGEATCTSIPSFVTCSS